MNNWSLFKEKGQHIQSAWTGEKLGRVLVWQELNEPQESIMKWDSRQGQVISCRAFQATLEFGIYCQYNGMPLKVLGHQTRF